MDSKQSPSPAVRRAPTPVKLVIAGGFGVGKTTTVGAISEITPLTTEAAMTVAGAASDQLGRTPDKTTTTVALDFGVITIDEAIKLYLFGTPGQDRFGFMWHDLTFGALGALVIVDTERIDDCYAAVDYFEQIKLPFVVGINMFDGKPKHSMQEIRWALNIGDHVPLVLFDARERLSVRDALLEVVRTARESLT
ncbi:MAG: ATP-binding protein [Corynebacteriales bacterium]|nr:ATP-binding protein [Mycobacteriales bacterium]